MASDDCGGVAATSSKQHFAFIRSVSGGNALPAGGGGSVVCISPGTMTTTEIQKQYTDVIVNPSNLFETAQNVLNYMKNPTTTITTAVGAYNYQWTLYPFSVNVEGDLEVFYRKGSDGKNHLIARATNILSSLIGTGTVYGTCTDIMPLYTCGNFSYQLAVTLVPLAPATGDPTWRTCLGGWWSGCQGACSAGCGGVNPPGGTNYVWGCTKLGTKFEHHGNTPGRLDGPLEWDLGVVSSADTSKLGIYIYGQVMRNPNTNPCSSSTPYVSGSGVAMTSGLAFKIPPLNVCPPEFIKIEQSADICEECVSATWHFEPNDLLGMSSGSLWLEYVANTTSIGTTDWSKAQAATFTVSPDAPISVTVPCLAPDTNYCWRAKIKLDTGYEAESEWEYGCMTTLFIPPANMSVPDITAAECTGIARGDDIAQFDKITSYDEGTL